MGGADRSAIHDHFGLDRCGLTRDKRQGFDLEAGAFGDQPDPHVATPPGPRDHLLEGV
jgi:hypothetical protein